VNVGRSYRSKEDYNYKQMVTRAAEMVDEDWNTRGFILYQNSAPSPPRNTP